MKKYLLSMFLLAPLAFSFGQYSGQIATNLSTGGSNDGGISSQINTLLGSTLERSDKLKNDYADFQGSPYISNTFLPTNMFYKNENLGGIYYRYNALNEEIEIKKSSLEEESIKSLSRDKEISILVNGKKMSFMTFVTSKKKTLNGYLTILNDGKSYDLFKRHYVKFTEGKPAANSFVQAVPSRFSQYTEYYFQKEGINRIDEIPLKNNNLIKLLDDSKKDELKKFLKANNLNIKNELDLIKAFDFLNK